MLNWKYENTILKKCGSLAALDEAGRGAWTGSIVAGAIFITNPKPKIPAEIKKIIKDSKLLSPKNRQLAYNFLTEKFIWATGIVDHKKIDKIGIQTANQLAMELAIANLKTPPHFILIDGRGFKFAADFKNIINGDATLLSIAAASIIAKVTRDNLLIAASKMFPQYHFDQNKGYGTAEHFSALCKHGLCPLHRQSFHPMKNMI